jgi:proline iminopeptidase
MPQPIPEPRASGFTTTADQPLYWVRYGREGAPLLIVLHGGPGADHRYLLPQMLRLGEQYDLLLYDQRGGGKSRTDDQSPVTWRTHVNDLARVAAEFSAEPLSLVGYSWGALLAMLYAIEAGRGALKPKPARLALLDPAPTSRTYREQFEEEMARRQSSPEVTEARRELTSSGLAERDRDAYRQRAFELSVAGYFAHLENARDLTPFRVIATVQQSVWNSLGDFVLAPDLGSVQVPAVVVHGRQDPIPLESSGDAAKALGAEFVVIDDCGHVPYVEQPDALFEALFRFLRSTNPFTR